MRADYRVKRFGVFLLILWLASTVHFFLPQLGGQDQIRAQLGSPAGRGGHSQSGPDRRHDETYPQLMHRAGPLSAGHARRKQHRGHHRQ